MPSSSPSLRESPGLSFDSKPLTPRYMGTELVGVTVGEAKVSRSESSTCAALTAEPAQDRPVRDPQDVLPDRLLLHYRRAHRRHDCRLRVVSDTPRSRAPRVGLGAHRRPLLAQAAAKGTSGGASASPFVVAIQSAGIRVLPSIINAWSVDAIVRVLQAQLTPACCCSRCLRPTRTSTSRRGRCTAWPRTATPRGSSPSARSAVCRGKCLGAALAPDRATWRATHLMARR